MKLDEFKAWFEGFTEGTDGAPTAKQWKRIKERVAEIDGVAISYPVYVERYVRPWYPSYWNHITTGALGVGTVYSANMATASAGELGANTVTLSLNDGHGGTAFDATSAMYAAGKAEAMAA